MDDGGGPGRPPIDLTLPGSTALDETAAAPQTAPWQISTPHAGPDRPGSGLRRRWPLLVLAVGFVALVVGHLLLQGPASGPFVYDEAGFLGNARLLAGNDNTWVMHAGPYYRFGYSLLLAPLFRFFSDPGDVYEAMTVLNAVLLSSVFPLVYVYLRRVHGATAVPALVGAAVGSIHPAVAAYGGIAFSENLLFPLFIVVLLAAWAFSTASGWRTLLLGPAAVSIVAVHSRFSAVIPITLALLAFIAYARPERRRSAAVNAGAILAGLLVIRLVDQWLIDARWVELTRPHDENGGVVGLLTDPRRWDVLLARGAGQSWYLLLTSAGLITVAVVALVAAVRPSRPAPAPGPGVWARELAAAPTRVASLFLLVVVAVEVATSVVFFTVVTLRSDHLIYGRYNETLLPVLLGLAVVTLLRWRWREVRLVTAANVALIVLLSLVVIHHPSMQRLREPGPLAHQTTTALALFGSEEELAPIAAVTLACALAFAALGVITRVTGRAAPWIALLVVVLLLAAGPSQDHAESQATRNAFREFPMDISRLGPIDRIAYSLKEPHRTGVGIHQFWMPQIDFVPWRSDEARPSEPWVVDRVAAEPSRADDLGGRMILADASTDEAIWLLPGDRLDDFVASGRVLPPRLDDVVPLEARQAELSLLGRGPGPVRVRAGDDLDLRVRVRHTGTGTAWVDDRSWALPGVVRLGGRWSSPGDPTRATDSPARGRLPHTIWPGQSFDTTITLLATDKTGAPLEPGTYTLRLDLLQEGVGWWAGVGSERLAVDVVVE